MATPLEQLRESRARLRAALDDVTCDVARLKRAAAASRARSDCGWKVSGRLRSTVLIACVLTEHAVDAAVELLTQRARQYGWRELSHAEVTKFVQDMLAAAGDDELAALSNLDAPRDPVALSAAATHVEEWRLAQWVAEQNRTAGVAPSTSSVLGRLAEQRGRLPVVLRPTVHRHVVGSAAARTWASRWRRRFGGRLAMLRPRDDLPLAAMREKAPLQSNHALPDAGASCTCTSGCHFGARFGDVLRDRFQTQN